MRPSCTRTRRFHLLDLNSGYYLNQKISLVPAEAWKNAEVWLGAVVLLAQRRSRQPGCKASGESQGIIRGGESSLSPLGCSRAFLGQKPLNVRKSQRGWRKLLDVPNGVLSPIGVQRVKPSGSGVQGAEEAPCLVSVSA